MYNYLSTSDCSSFCLFNYKKIIKKIYPTIQDQSSILQFILQSRSESNQNNKLFIDFASLFEIHI